MRLNQMHKDYALLRCAVCGDAMQLQGGSLRCRNGHCFDVAKEGYVNLLRGSKNGDKIGDDKLAARSRHAFLEKGYYAPLRDALCAIFFGQRGTLLDICCGEGYYTDALARLNGPAVYGFDISREMVRLAAKRGHATCFVANMANIPVADGTFDYATHLFAPFIETEFARVLKPGGRLYSVIPGREHLFGLKQVLYASAYYNDERLPQTNLLRPIDTRRVSAQIVLTDPQDMQSLFHMTPYYFHTSPTDREKLSACTRLETKIEFLIVTYEKAGE